MKRISRGAKHKSNRYERTQEQVARKAKALHGEGLYVFRNRSGELNLPKPAKDGRNKIGPHKEFEGDSYFLEMVRKNELILVKTLITPEQERENMSEQKLILDQPDKVTNEGTVEHVISNPAKQLQEQQPAQEEVKDVLLSEDPVDGVEIILND